MQTETRNISYDKNLHIEAYRFKGISQPFPNHTHNYYVIGFIKSGTRSLVCKNKTYSVGAGDILIFNPGDSHRCIQSDGGTLDYVALNISKKIMLYLTEEITGQKYLPYFKENVVENSKTEYLILLLYSLISTNEDSDFKKKRKPFAPCIPAYRKI